MRLVTFQQRSFLSPWPLATARYKGNFLLLQVTFLFSQAPSVGKGEVREAASGPLSRCYLCGPRGLQCGLCLPVWGALATTYPVSSRPPFPSPQIHTQHSGPLLCRVSAGADLTVPCPLCHSFSRGHLLLVPTSARSAWRCLLIPLVPGRHRRNLLLGKAPPPGPPVPCVMCSPSLLLPLSWPISASHIWKGHFWSCPHRPLF